MEPTFRRCPVPDELAIVTVTHTCELCEQAVNPVLVGRGRVDDGKRLVPQSPLVLDRHAHQEVSIHSSSASRWGFRGPY